MVSMVSAKLNQLKYYLEICQLYKSVQCESEIVEHPVFLAIVSVSQRPITETAVGHYH